MCGGTFDFCQSGAVNTGLSPRVRGNLLPRDGAGANAPSIPACAGEPVQKHRQTGRVGVYPRVCGGTHIGVSGVVAARGLSPRVRGNPDKTPVSGGPARSIPACAGEPRCAGPGGGGGEVYPRVCGGTLSRRATNACILGLSPRVRGNRYRTDAGLKRNRSIPACAGEPLSGPQRVDNPAVYPRVCGGTQTFAIHHKGGGGLSPRVRGNRGSSFCAAYQRGSIPACAGEPGQ